MARLLVLVCTAHLRMKPRIRRLSLTGYWTLGIHVMVLKVGPNQIVFGLWIAQLQY